MLASECIIRFLKIYRDYRFHFNKKHLQYNKAKLRVILSEDYRLRSRHTKNIKSLLLYNQFNAIIRHVVIKIYHLLNISQSFNPNLVAATFSVGASLNDAKGQSIFTINTNTSLVIKTSRGSLCRSEHGDRSCSV